MDFGEDGFGRKAAAFSADERNDAKGTAIVTAVLDFENRASVIRFSAEDGSDENVAGFEDVAGEDAGRSDDVKRDKIP